MNFDAVVELRGTEQEPEGFRVIDELGRRFVLESDPNGHDPRWILHRTVVLERVALVGTPRP